MPPAAVPWGQLSLTAAAGVTSACLAYWAVRGGRPLLALLQRQLDASMEDEEEQEVPEEFQCPISLGCMKDPVLLCGTGQAYCLHSLRAWLSTGSRTCPKSNTPLRDIQVVRLPGLRSRIAAWRQQAGLPPLPPLDPPAEVLAEAGAAIPALMVQLRGGDVYKRGLAAGQFNDLLIEWGREEPLTPARQQVTEALLLDLVWLMRQGDPYGSGVAAAALSQYPRGTEQLCFLAAVAATPAVMLLWATHTYAQHSAARLLANLVHAGPRMPEVLAEAGAVRGLLPQLDLRHPMPYNRCSAAAALAGMCECEAARAEARAAGAIPLLKELVHQPEEGGGGGLELRYQKRDAASALLALRLTSAEAAAAPGVEWELLRQLSMCSSAWLLGEAEGPTEGYSPEELAMAALAQPPPFDADAGERHGGAEGGDAAAAAVGRPAP